MIVLERRADDARGLRLLALSALLAAGCRFGGPSANPDAYVSFPSDATTTDGASDATASEPDDGTAESDANAGLDAASDAGRDGAADDGSSDASEFALDGPETCDAGIAVCDPIHDTGCNALQQCDVDLTQTATPTGACVFSSAQVDGGACTSSVFSESCPPAFTCVSSACRQLCACDSDCAPGQCCSDTRGPAGFLLCQPCP